MDPAGLSLEYPVMATDLGSAGCPPPTLAAELARLGSPPLQLGGVSQDQTAPPGSADAAADLLADGHALPAPGRLLGSAPLPARRAPTSR